MLVGRIGDWFFGVAETNPVAEEDLISAFFFGIFWNSKGRAFGNL